MIERVGPLDVGCRYFMDWDYWLRAGLTHQIVHVPNIWSTYRLHPSSNTVAHAARFVPELEWIYRRFFAQRDVRAPLRSRARRAMANMYFRSAGYYVRAHVPRQAARMGRVAPQGPSARL